MTPTTAVKATGLVKTFGGFRAVDHIDLEVRQREILGVLGPNGAGKTTTLKMLATLLPIDAGQAWVFGVDVAREPHRVRQLLGVTGQYASVDDDLTASENLWLFGRLQGLARRRLAPPRSGCFTSSDWRRRRTSQSRSSRAACDGAWMGQSKKRSAAVGRRPIGSRAVATDSVALAPAGARALAGATASGGGSFDRCGRVPGSVTGQRLREGRLRAEARGNRVADRGQTPRRRARLTGLVGDPGSGRTRPEPRVSSR